MSERPALEEDYAAALSAHLTAQSEETLARAYAIGRAALGEGLGIVDLAAAHARALLELPRSPQPAASASEDAHRAASTFFAEAVSPFEMALRLFQEANDQLRALNEDLTNRNAELVAAREAAESATRELEQFTASVSHDLRAPVRRVRSFATILAEDLGPRLDDESRRHLERVCASADQMSHLIDDLLRLSRVARSELSREPCDISAMASTILSRLADAEPQRQVTVAVAEGIVVDGDRRLLAVVLENLLGNAWKFTGQAVDPRIEVTEQDHAVVIQDNGAGFDPSGAHRLFLPFQRLHADNAFEGTGIGLATVGRIIRRHGGHVRAEGAVGRGATFSFTTK